MQEPAHLAPALSQLSNPDSAVDGGSESAARAGVAEARQESDLAVEMDDFHNSPAGAPVTVARLVEIVQGDNATSGALGARNPWQSISVRCVGGWCLLFGGSRSLLASAWRTSRRCYFVKPALSCAW